MLALALLAAAPLAHAGGIGLLGTGGFHGDRIYYYKQNAIGEYEQMAPEDQLNPNAGGGIELMIGDKDYKINGFFRLYYMVDGPVTAPAEEFTYNLRTEEWRQLGVLDAGLHFGVLGDPERFQGVIIGMIGSGFLTNDQTEFAQAQAGLGATYTLDRHVQFHAEVTGGTRYRKRFYPIGSGSAGVRYLFD